MIICHHNQLKRQCPLCDLESEVADLKQEISTYKAWQPNAWENAQELYKLKQEVVFLKADNAALMECVEWYASFWNHDVQVESTGKTSMKSDGGRRARECLAKLGGAE